MAGIAMTTMERSRTTNFYNNTPEEPERRVYLPEEEQQITQLLPLAEQLRDEPEVAERFAVMKWLTMGASDRDERFAGRHPWPERSVNGETYVYSVPAVAGIMVRPDPRTSETNYIALSVMKDNWRRDDDPEAWLVTTLDLSSNTSRRHPVMTTEVDAKHQAFISLQPANYHNMPPLSRPNPEVTRLRDLAHIGARLDSQYHALDAMYVDDRHRPSPVIDIELLAEALRRVTKEPSYKLDNHLFADGDLNWKNSYPKKPNGLENDPSSPVTADVHAARQKMACRVLKKTGLVNYLG